MFQERWKENSTDSLQKKKSLHNSTGDDFAEINFSGMEGIEFSLQGGRAGGPGGQSKGDSGLGQRQVVGSFQGSPVAAQSLICAKGTHLASKS